MAHLDEEIDLTGVDFSGIELEEFDVDDEGEGDISISYGYRGYREYFDDVDVDVLF